MFARLYRRRAAAHGVEFCESCGQVCTTECRAQARLAEIRAQALHQYQPGLLLR